MRSLLREPLVHFLLGGAALFLLYGQVAAPGTDRPDRIVVSEQQVAMLARGFERTWLRPPTPAELDGLIDDFVTEEVLYREALALGLDRDDLVVRRRMRQKMEFLNDELSEPVPDDAALRAFLEANPERFRLPPRVTFVQVFLAADGDGSEKERADPLLARLRAGADAAALGDPTPLPSGGNEATPSQIAGTFGESFATALLELPEKQWSGPVASSFGLHLVRVEAREPTRVPAFDEVRDAVARDWRAQQREEARERFYEALRARYELEVQRPASPATAEVARRR